jgi:hypothetical protein
MASRMMALVCGLAMLSPSCTADRAGRPVVFPPFSYRSELPRVSFYPRIVMPGKEVVIMARPMEGFSGETCLRVIDGDAFAWFETCWEGGDSRRVTFQPVKVGRHFGYLAYASGDGWLTTSNDKAELCVLGENADCP